MAVTIKDVAKHAGVAPSTVSRVIKDSPAISDKTKKKVRAAMHELNYYPNWHARNLVNQESQVIGLVLPPASDAFYQNPFFPTVLRGIAEEATQADISLLLATGSDLQDRLQQVERMTLGRFVDGLIFLYAASGDPLIERVSEMNLPFVVIGRSDQEGVASVNNDNVQASFDATQHLVGAGYQSIAFIGGSTDQEFIFDRIRGYRQALEAQGYSYQEDLIFNQGEFLPSFGQEVAQMILADPRIDAVVTADELVAQGLERTLRDYPERSIAQMTFRAYKEEDRHPDSATRGYVDIQAIDLGRQSFQLLAQLIADPSSKDQDWIVGHELFWLGQEVAHE